MSEDGTVEAIAAELVGEEPKPKPRNKGGRPRGSGTGAGMLTREGRIKVLAKIASNSKAKAADRIAAVKAITDILNDKVRDEGRESPVTTLRLEAQETHAIPPVNEAVTPPEPTKQTPEPVPPVHQEPTPTPSAPAPSATPVAPGTHQDAPGNVSLEVKLEVVEGAEKPDLS